DRGRVRQERGKGPASAHRDRPQGRRGAWSTGLGGTAMGAVTRPHRDDSRLAEDAVELRAALGADALGHAGALLADLDLTAGLALLLALHAVELARPCLRHSGLLADAAPPNVAQVTLSLGVKRLQARPKPCP